MDMVKNRSSQITLALLFLILPGCGFESGGSAPGGRNLSVPIVNAQCTSPSTQVVDYGVKSGVAATARGIWSDVEYIPSGVTAGTGAASGNVVEYSSNVGIAYTDSGAQSLKYSYWTGSTFKTEVVYGNSVANITYVRLAYLSNAPNTGLPMIFFTNGAVNSGQVMVAIRSTASTTTSAATWAVQQIGANGGVVNRALEVSVSPIDQVALVYQGTTVPTANNIRFISCSANCQTAANYVDQGTTAASRIDSGATAAQVQLGVGWCQISSGIYNPAVVYGASATTHQFAICNSGAGNDLSACVSNTGWTRTTATMPATGASGTVSTLNLDPSIIGDIPKIVVKDAGSSLRMFETSVGCNSVVSGTTYTAAGSSAIVGSAIANIATSHLELLKAADYATPANQRFFLGFNDGTASVRWAASTNGTFTGAWNANATGFIQTVTLNAAATTNLGVALNTTTRQLITSYGTAAGAFNITLGVVNDFTSPSDPSSASQSYFQLPVEGSGNMQLPAAQIQNVNVAATSGSLPAVAWVDYSSGVATTGRLKYARRTGTTATSSWQIISVPGAFATPAPQYPSLAFDHLDRPWIAYWDSQGAAGRFVLATNTASDGSGTWTSYMFPVIAAGHGAPVAQPAANMATVTMSYSGGIARPVMIVIDNGTTKAVKSAMLDTNSGVWSSVTTIESLALQGAAFLTADWSKTSNLVVIGYQVLTTGSVRLRYTASTNGSAWPVNASTPFSVSSLATGEGANIKINPASGLPAISYYDRANSRLYYSNCTSNCTGSGVPVFNGTVSSVLSGLGITGLSALGNANLLNAALSYSLGGTAYIVLNSGQLGSGGLFLADNTDTAAPFATPAVLVPGANGAFANASATNGGIPWGQSVVRMDNGVLAAAYNSPGNWLSVTTCGD